MKFRPKRGKSSDIYQVDFVSHELFYVTDLKMLGVTDENGIPELLVKVEEYDDKGEFPKEGESNVVYLSKETGLSYIFDGKDYFRIALNFPLYGSRRPKFLSL